ncbi:hypothetical protein [Cupriavidus sp.]|uniref:hypothetical protein n=1 Tax=Cupriavidus sp. TaxID=1873897 RepID=UPI003D120223
MARADEQNAIAREIGQKIQECRALVEKVDGAVGVRVQLDKVLEKIAKWGETERAMTFGGDRHHG